MCEEIDRYVALQFVNPNFPVKLNKVLQADIFKETVFFHAHYVICSYSDDTVIKRLKCWCNDYESKEWLPTSNYRITSLMYNYLWLRSKEVRI